MLYIYIYIYIYHYILKLLFIITKFHKLHQKLYSENSMVTILATFVRNLPILPNLHTQNLKKF